MKKFRAAIGIGLAAAAMAALLSGCGSHFKVSKEMAGNAPVAKSVENLEKLDDKLTQEFLQKAAKKYDGQVQDMDFDMDGAGEIVLDLGDLLGDDADMGLRTEFGGGIAVNRDGQAAVRDLGLKLSIPVLGDLTARADAYTDSKGEYDYSMLKEFKAENGLFELMDTDETEQALNQWKKSPVEKKEAEPEAEAKDLFKLPLAPENVNGVYLDKNTGAYILDLKAEALNTMQDKAVMQNAENEKLYLTFDEGLAFSGLYAAADSITVKVPETGGKESDGGIADEIADEALPEELEIRDFSMTVAVKAINSGADLTAPEDVKTSAVEEDPDSPMDILSDLQ